MVLLQENISYIHINLSEIMLTAWLKQGMQTFPEQGTGISGICQSKWVEQGHENTSLFHSLVIFKVWRRKLRDIQSRPKERDLI